MSFDITPLGEVLPPEPETPKIYNEQYRHSIVEGTYQPETALITMVQGTPFVVEYYRQRVAPDEEPQPFDPFNAATYNQYTRIRRLIVKSEGDGAFNFDPQKAESDVKYTGWVSFGLPPIRGDVFIAEIMDGRAGLFQITEQPEPPNFTANKAYRITFQMVGILQKDWADELERRVQQELVYSIDSALSGGVGLVSEDDFDTEAQLFQWRTTIGQWIMTKFWWNPERTIAYNTSGDTEILGGYVYDQYLVKFLSAVIEPDMRVMYPVIGQLSTQYGGRDFGMHGTINIWDVILRGDFNLLSQCPKGAAMIGVDRLVNSRLYGNLRSSKFTYFICTDPEEYKQYKVYYNMDGYPILRPSPQSKIGSYVFGEAFYNGEPETVFEKLVYKILKQKIVPRKELLAYCKDEYFKLTPKEQLYHGAILILLIQVSRKFGVPS